MTNNDNTYDAFPIDKMFGEVGRAHAYRIVSIEPDGYFNVKTSLPTGPAFVALYDGEAFRVSSATGDENRLVSLNVVHAGLFGLHGEVEWSGVMVAPVPSTNLVYRDDEQTHNHPNDLNGHRTIGTYTVCDATAEYWITEPPMTFAEAAAI